jgi:hypothetical protein
MLKTQVYDLLLGLVWSDQLTNTHQRLQANEQGEEKQAEGEMCCQLLTIDF